MSKLLFICSRNQWRSLTAEKIFEHLEGYQVRSVGTEENARIKVTAGHIGWGDIIFVMEKKHKSKIQSKFNEELLGKTIICLNIPDDYGFMDEELIGLLESSVSEYIEIT